MSPWFQKDEPSSRLNKVPPMGAPKAAATPAAAPADTKSRLSLRREERDGLSEKQPSGCKRQFFTSLCTGILTSRDPRTVRAHEGQVSGEATRQPSQFTYEPKALPRRSSASWGGSLMSVDSEHGFSGGSLEGSGVTAEPLAHQTFLPESPAPEKTYQVWL